MDHDEDRQPGETTQEWIVRMARLTLLEDAEFYAAGGRRLTLHHPDLERLPDDVRHTIDTAADRAGYSGGGGVFTGGAINKRFTRWSWPAGHGYDPAAVAAAAATAARALDPAWTLVTDDDPER